MRARIVTRNSRSLQLAVPKSDAASVMSVTFKDRAGRRVGQSSYEYLAPPAIAQTSPAVALLHCPDRVVVSGTNLRHLTGVTVNDQAVRYGRISDTKASFWPPAKLDGQGDIVVTTRGGQSAPLSMTFGALPTSKSAGPSVELVSLDDCNRPFAAADSSGSLMSPNGQHIVSNYSGARGDNGLRYRDLRSGRTEQLPSEWGYGDRLDISADGRRVAFSRETERSSSGQVLGLQPAYWDTATGVVVQIGGAATSEGSVNQVRITADGNQLIFDSSSAALMPDPAKTCAEARTESCISTEGWVHVFDARTRKIDTLPYKPEFVTSEGVGNAALAVISDDGRVVAFKSGFYVYLWYRDTGVVRALDNLGIRCGSSGSTLALSGDGSTLLDTCGFQTSLIRLGGPDGGDELRWFVRDTDFYVHTGDISFDGNRFAFTRQPGPQGWSLWPTYFVDLLASEEAELLPAPEPVRGLRPVPEPPAGMATLRISVSAEGRYVALDTCSNRTFENPSYDDQGCPERADTYRWRTNVT